MSYLEFDRIARQISSQSGRGQLESDIHDPNVRAQELFDNAVSMQRVFGAGRVILVVKESEVCYELVPREPRNGSIDAPTSHLPQEGVLFDSTQTLPVENSPNGSKAAKGAEPKNDKGHDLRGLSGFYKGTFYRDGVGQPKKKQR